MGLSQKHLARILDVDESTVGRWEAGRSLPRKKSAKALLAGDSAFPTEEERPGD